MRYLLKKKLKTEFLENMFSFLVEGKKKIKAIN